MNTKQKIIIILSLSLVIALLIIFKPHIFNRQNTFEYNSHIVLNATDENQSIDYIKRFTSHKIYIPSSEFVTIIPPNTPSVNFSRSFRLHFPSSVITNKEMTDCNSGVVLPVGSKVLLTGGDGFSGYGWGYALGTSQTQVNPDEGTDFGKHQYNLCSDAHSINLITLNVVKDYDYAEMQKIGFEDDNTKFIGEQKIKVGNIETQAKIYEYIVTPPKPLYGKAVPAYKLSVYHFNVKDDYFIIQKPIYDGTIETAFDDKVLNETIDYIWNHLEFE